MNIYTPKTITSNFSENIVVNSYEDLLKNIIFEPVPDDLLTIGINKLKRYSSLCNFEDEPIDMIKLARYQKLINTFEYKFCYYNDDQRLIISLSKIILFMRIVNSNFLYIDENIFPFHRKYLNILMSKYIK